MTVPKTESRSPLAMLLSAVLPGFGQLYLGRFPKGVLLLALFSSAVALFYLNSLPVTEWQDLLRFRTTPAPAATDETERTGASTESAEAQEAYAIHVWTFDDGEKLMYRPSWKLKLSMGIQALLCWLYAVIDGWKGRQVRKIG